MSGNHCCCQCEPVATSDDRVLRENNVPFLLLVTRCHRTEHTPMRTAKDFHGENRG